MKNGVTNPDYLLCARHCAKHFIKINSFNFQHHPMSLLYYKLNYIITPSIITILLIKILKVTIVNN